MDPQQFTTMANKLQSVLNADFPGWLTKLTNVNRVLPAPRLDIYNVIRNSPT